MSINFYVTFLVILLAAVSCEKCDRCSSCKDKGEKKDKVVIQQETAPSRVLELSSLTKLNEILKNDNEGVMVVFLSLGNECPSCVEYDKESTERFSTFSDLVKKYPSKEYPSFTFYKVLITDTKDRNEVKKTVHDNHPANRSGNVYFPIVAVYKNGKLLKITQGEEERNKLSTFMDTLKNKEAQGSVK